MADAIPRGTRPDAVTEEALYLIKNVTRLRLTNQIRLSTFMAIRRGLTVVIAIPRTCELSAPLLAFRADHAGVIRVTYFEDA
jgi:hypothetical protein